MGRLFDAILAGNLVTGIKAGHAHHRLHIHRTPAVLGMSSKDLEMCLDQGIFADLLAIDKTFPQYDRCIMGDGLSFPSGVQ